MWNHWNDWSDKDYDTVIHRMLYLAWLHIDNGYYPEGNGAD